MCSSIPRPIGTNRVNPDRISRIYLLAILSLFFASTLAFLTTAAPTPAVAATTSAKASVGHVGKTARKSGSVKRTKGLRSRKTAKSLAGTRSARTGKLAVRKGKGKRRAVARASSTGKGYKLAKSRKGKRIAARSGMGKGYRLAKRKWAGKKRTRLAHRHVKGRKYGFLSPGVTRRSGRRVAGGVTWNAASGCLPAAIRNTLYEVSRRYGPVVVNSTHRGHSHNRRVGGAKRSWHLRCMAADFRVHGGGAGLFSFLASRPGIGGVHRYRSGFFHIDTGPRRRW